MKKLFFLILSVKWIEIVCQSIMRNKTECLMINIMANENMYIDANREIKLSRFVDQKYQRTKDTGIWRILPVNDSEFLYYIQNYNGQYLIADSKFTQNRRHINNVETKNSLDESFMWYFYDPMSVNKFDFLKNEDLNSSIITEFLHIYSYKYRQPLSVYANWKKNIFWFLNFKSEIFVDINSKNKEWILKCKDL
jgi:hypothetical protein